MKKIACDVDGVILNFSKNFQKFVWDKYGQYISLDPILWDYNKALPVAEYFGKFIEEGDHFNYEYVDSRITLIFKELYKEHKRVIDLVTAFPEHRKEDRQCNLINILPYYNQLIISQGEKHLWLEERQDEYSILIDDKPITIEKVSEFMPVVFPMYEYNRHLRNKSNCYPYLRFEEVPEIIGGIL
jgi:hypothetical protein